MPSNSLLERIFGRAESLASGVFIEMQRAAGMQAQQRMLGQLLAQVSLALNSDLGKEAIAELESRIRVLLYHFSGRAQFTNVLADVLRTQIKEVEAGARRLIAIADADYSHNVRDVGWTVHSYDRQAEAIRLEAKALSEIARRIAGICTPLESIIPADFDVLASNWGADAQRILAEAASVGHDAQEIVPTSVLRVVGPSEDAETSAPVPAIQATAQHGSFHFGSDKERALRRDAFALAESLDRSMSGLRHILDDGQHPGVYDIAALHAVTKGLRDKMLSLEQRLSALNEKSLLPVKLVG